MIWQKLKAVVQVSGSLSPQQPNHSFSSWLVLLIKIWKYSVHFSFALTCSFFMLTYGTETVGTSSDDSSGEEEDDDEENGDSGKKCTFKTAPSECFSISTRVLQGSIFLTSARIRKATYQNRPVAGHCVHQPVAVNEKTCNQTQNKRAEKVTCTVALYFSHTFQFIFINHS